MAFRRGSVEFSLVDGLIVRVGEDGVSGRVSILMNLLINFMKFSIVDCFLRKFICSHIGLRFSYLRDTFVLGSDGVRLSCRCCGLVW